MTKARGNLVVSSRKVIHHRGVNIRKTVSEFEVKIISSSLGVRDMLRKSSYVGFKFKVKVIRTGSLGGPADLRSIKVFCYNFRFSVGGCNVLKRLHALTELKVVLWWRSVNISKVHWTVMHIDKQQQIVWQNV